jgi:transglutaminase-like putative cysteine protease/predicted glutamine amidotransferase
MKTHLMALSFDNPSSPAVHFQHVHPVHVAGRVPCGWGFAWFPEGDSAAAIVKDPTSTGDDAMASVLHDWNRFRSTVFISFVLGAARRRTQQDTHPFHLRYAGRDWVLTHNGTLKDFQGRLPLDEANIFEPAGRTDSEWVLCWLLTQMRARGARRLADVGWQTVADWCATINDLGTANLVFTDGFDLVVYHDRGGFNELYYNRRTPPHEVNDIELGLIRLNLRDAYDYNRSLIIFSSVPPRDEKWERLTPGQMLVARRGAIVHDRAAAQPAGAASAKKSGRVPSRTAGQGPSGRRAPATSGNGPTAGDAPPSSHSSQPPTRHAVATARPARKSRPSEQELLSRHGRRAREIRVHHETVYRYREPVARSIHLLRLQPVHDRYQDVLEHRLKLTVSGTQRHFEDVFGNHTVELDVETPFDEFRVESESVLRLYAHAYDALEFPNRMTRLPLVWMPWQRQMMSPYLLPSELPETELRELSDFATAAVERNDYDLLDTLSDLNATIYRDFEYVPKSTSLDTTPYEVFAARRGVCQDFANLLICLARLLDVPARYRVGYLHTGNDYANKAQADASHAWAELYLPWIGWRGFDPTNGCMVAADHVRVACGRNYRDATPTAGTIFSGGAGESMTVAVRVEARDIEA